jgi:hypothetical protein
LTPTNYFEEALSLFEALPWSHTDVLCLANRKVHLRTPSMAIRELFLPSISHLVDRTAVDIESPELTIWYAEEKDLPAKLKAPPWEGFNGQGYNASLDQDEVQLFFQPWQKQVFLYSRKKRIGIYWVKESSEVPWWECTFSFRILLHLWTQDLPAQLVHAGAIAKDGEAFLITGKSGSGKSTSCLNLLRAGYQYLGDDYVWLELGKEVAVHTLYQTAKIEPENVDERFQDWKPFIQNKDLYRKQKAIFDVHQLFPASAIPSATLKGILLPKVLDQESTTMMKSSATHALMAMAPTTLHHLPHNRVGSYQKMTDVSASLPAYHWHLGRDKNAFLNSFSTLFTHEKAAY